MGFENGAYGTAQGATDLANTFKGTMMEILGSVERISRACNSLSGSWDDEGLNDAQELVNSVNNAIKSNAQDYAAVYKAILAYADFLSRH